MPGPFIVYGLADPESGAVRYIGKSSSGKNRAFHHQTPARLAIDDTHKGRWLKGLIAKGMKAAIVVLETCTDHDALCAAEIRWIAHGRSEGWGLTNITAGGERGRSGLKFSPESIAKMKEWSRRFRKPPVVTPEARERIRLSAIGRKASEGAIANMRRAQQGNRPPPSAIEKVKRMWKEDGEFREKMRSVVAASNRRRSPQGAMPWR